MVPNLLWALLPGAAEPPSTEAPASAIPKHVRIVEGAGRVAVFVLPFFLDWHVRSAIDRVVFGVGALALALYYVGWGRYFLGGRSSRLLFAPLGPIVAPLAVFPVVCLLTFAFLARSPAMASVTVLFGAAHVFACVRRAGAA